VKPKSRSRLFVVDYIIFAEVTELSRNLPALLCFDNSGIVTARTYSSDTIYYKATKSAREVFYYMKLISGQLRIFNPVNCKLKLTGEMTKH